MEPLQPLLLGQGSARIPKLSKEKGALPSQPITSGPEFKKAARQRQSLITLRMPSLSHFG